jgi:ATP-dependent DNA helicase PIF1
MVGRKLFSRMDARLRDAFPEKQNEMFGGCSILLLGDFAQLPPVGDISLFNLHPQVRGNPETVMASNKGRALYITLTESITLDRIMRQQGEDPPAVQFRQVLSNLQSMEATEPDRQFLNTRYIDNLSAEELEGFEDALNLCPTNALMNEINESKMSSSGKPVLTLPAHNKGPEASKASDDDAEGLAEKLLLMEGAKVMLTRNIWTTKGLTNGSIGSIGTTFNSRNSLIL